MGNNYVDNGKLLQAFKEYLKACKIAKKEKITLPRIPDFIGECFLLIATRLAMHPHYCNYTFKDEMISDAIENCILYCHNFNIKKSKNPFGYITMIMVRAFWRRIEKEKKQMYIKYKSIQNSSLFDILVTHDANDESGMDTPSYIDMSNQKMETLIVDFEAKVKRKKAEVKKKKKTKAKQNLEKFIK